MHYPTRPQALAECRRFRTPLTAAVQQAADALDSRNKPGLVILTDGEETCGGSPCDVSEKLYVEADQLTIHVIGLRVKNYTWIGDQGILDAKCLAEKNGGQYLPWTPWTGCGRHWKKRSVVRWSPTPARSVSARAGHQRGDGGEQALQVLRARLAMLGILDQRELDVAPLQ
jgi:hypothetical protein